MRSHLRCARLRPQLRLRLLSRRFLGQRVRKVHTVDRRNPFRTTLIPWLVFTWGSSFQGFLGDAKWISSSHSIFDIQFTATLGQRAANTTTMAIGATFGLAAEYSSLAHYCTRNLRNTQTARNGFFMSSIVSSRVEGNRQVCSLASPSRALRTMYTYLSDNP